MKVEPQFWFWCHMLSGNGQAVHICIVVDTGQPGIHSPNMDAPDHYQTTYDRKNKIVFFNSLNLCHYILNYEYLRILFSWQLTSVLEIYWKHHQNTKHFWMDLNNLWFNSKSFQIWSSKHLSFYYSSFWHFLMDLNLWFNSKIYQISFDYSYIQFYIPFCYFFCVYRQWVYMAMMPPIMQQKTMDHYHLIWHMCGSVWQPT